MSIIIPQQIILPSLPAIPHTSNGLINSKPVVYPIYESSVTYGIDQMVTRWNEEKYLPSTTSLGKIFDWITGWTLNEKGERNPSLFDRMKNVFKKSQNKEIIKEADVPEEEIFQPSGNIIDKKIHWEESNGTFVISYWQKNCNSPTYIYGNWEIFLNIVSKDIDGYYFTSPFQNCMIDTVLKDYLQEVSEFCNANTVCGCSDETKSFSYIFIDDQSYLKIYNSGSAITEVLLPNQSYPFPSKDLISECYDFAYQYQLDAIHQENVIIGSCIAAGAGTMLIFIGGSLAICCIAEQKKKNKLSMVESSKVEIELSTISKTPDNQEINKEPETEKLLLHV